MPARDVYVHLVPQLVEPARLRGAIAVVIDVLRATTTIVHALAAGCTCVRPCGEIDEATTLAKTLNAKTTLLAGERGGKPIADFDLGNSPCEYTSKKCKGKTLVLTTSNGTRAILRTLEAERVLIASFVNFSAVCEQLHDDARPVHIVCAGCDGEPCMEDTLLAGAIVEFYCEEMNPKLNDSARLAWDCFENHGRILRGSLDVCQAGEHLRSLGMGDDIALCAEVDKFALVPELYRAPLRIELASAGIVKARWAK